MVFRKYNRNAFARVQLNYCLSIIKKVIQSQSKCMLLKSKYYEIYLTIKYFAIAEGGCAQCKAVYDDIYISGLSYNLICDDPKYNGRVFPYSCKISQFFVLCLCNEEDIENIHVFDLDEDDSDNDNEFIRSYDLLFKFEAKDDLYLQYVASIVNV